MPDSSLYGNVVREINILGLKQTKEFIVARELASKAGEPYTEKTASLDFTRLDKLKIFSDIQFQPRPEGDQIVLDVVLKETFPYLPMIGFNATEENGVSYGGGGEAINLFGRAISGRASFMLGGVRSISLGLRNPWIFGDHVSYAASYVFNVRDNKVVNFRENAHEFSLQFRSWVKEHGRLLARFQFLAIGADSAGATLSRKNRDNVPVLGFGIGIDSRDRLLNTQSGVSSFVELFKHGLLGLGDVDFWQLVVDLAAFFSISERHTIHVASLTELRTGTVGKEVAPWQLFSVGGSNTVRGHRLNERVGKNEMINTAEYRFTAMKPRPVTLPFGIQWVFGLHLAAFTDIGHAWSNGTKFSFGQFITGYGIGARILMPSAMLRFDYAAGQAGIGVLFEFGAQEKTARQRARVR